MAVWFYTTLMIFSWSVMGQDEFERWSKIQQPSTGPAQVVGFYSAGCLSGARAMTRDGDGFSVMRPSRLRFYGHPSLIEYLKLLVKDLKKAKLPLVLIGDLSPPRGGPMRQGHSSHQSGLDVDIWLRMSKARPTAKQKESWEADSYVENRKALKRNWGPYQIKLVELATQREGVERVFVSPAIKKFFCEKNPQAAWLYRLRPWWGHEDHIHVRLKCPADSPQCTPQAPMNPTDSGCGADLEWWFSKEADDEWHKLVTEPKPREFPKLPENCEPLVAGEQP